MGLRCGNYLGSAIDVFELAQQVGQKAPRLTMLDTGEALMILSLGSKNWQYVVVQPLPHTPRTKFQAPCLPFFERFHRRSFLPPTIESHSEQALILKVFVLLCKRRDSELQTS